MAEKNLLHVAHIPVRWGDMDSYGHVNNTLYIQYLEEARVACHASNRPVPVPESLRRIFRGLPAITEP